MNQKETDFEPNDMPNASGHFGQFGGMYVPETLMTPLYELKKAYMAAKQDPEYNRVLDEHLREFAGRPTNLYFAERLHKQPSIPQEEGPNLRITAYCKPKRKR